ncbi:hypothetical protein HN011_003535 [Eciton burchellii]|nr:hypothetical protein HN011_003535 [Eciton burchellii]
MHKSVVLLCPLVCSARRIEASLRHSQAIRDREDLSVSPIRADAIHATKRRGWLTPTRDNGEATCCTRESSSVRGIRPALSRVIRSINSREGKFMKTEQAKPSPVRSAGTKVAEDRSGDDERSVTLVRIRMKIRRKISPEARVESS